MPRIRGTQHSFDNGVDPVMNINVCWWESFEDCHTEYVKQHGGAPLDRTAAFTRFTVNGGWSWVDLNAGVVHVVEARQQAPKRDREAAVLPLIAHELAHLFLATPSPEESENVAAVVGNIMRMAQQIVR